ncbi:MAG: hypothetical protein ACEQSH_00115 [Bacteroidia bacterium]
MATNPRVPQGVLNRIRGSIVIPAFPALNIIAANLSRAGISLSFQGDATQYLPTLTGAVRSPEVYMVGMLRIGLLRTQPLGAAYKAKLESDTYLADLTVVPDAAGFPDTLLNNCSISGVNEMGFAGEDASYGITVTGYYDINSDLWNLI